MSLELSLKLLPVIQPVGLIPLDEQTPLVLPLDSIIFDHPRVYPCILALDTDHRFGLFGFYHLECGPSVSEVHRVPLEETRSVEG